MPLSRLQSNVPGVFCKLSAAPHGVVTPDIHQSERAYGLFLPIGHCFSMVCGWPSLFFDQNRAVYHGKLVFTGRQADVSIAHRPRIMA
jgi:hypothetical protein